MNNLTISTPAQLNTQQISDCIAIINYLSGWLNREDVGESMKLSLETTIIKATNRLDSILDDGTRWQMPQRETEDGHKLACAYANSQLALVGHKLFELELNKQVALGNIEKVIEEARALEAAKQQPQQQQPTPQPRRRKKQ